MAINQGTLLEIESVYKSFPGVQALDNVSMELKKGEIHGLVGENGAGKTTLVKIITGVLQPDKGKVSFFKNGKGVSINSPMEAKYFGVATAYQHLVIAPELSVGENFFLGKLPTGRAGIVNWRQIFSESEKVLTEFNINVNPRERIKNLNAARQVMITIIKVLLMDNISMTILDEPTALLTNEQCAMLFDLIRKLKEKGISTLYISHHIEEVLNLCDRITILKDGKVVDTVKTTEVDKDKIISMMVGRKLEDVYKTASYVQEEEILRVEKLTKEPYFRDVSFSLKKGEILGFFGLVGAGRTEVMRCLYGADRADSGKIYLRGKEVKFKSPQQALDNGIGLLPEDRQSQGLALPLSVKHNINIASLNDISKWGVVNIRRETARALQFIDNLHIKTPSYNEKVLRLSGGNQQKIVIAKLLCKNLDILIFDEATAGIDVGAKIEVYKLMESLVKQGKSIIFVSSYLPEVIGMSDRIIVMAEGRVVGLVNNKDASEEKLLQMASEEQREEYHYAKI